MQSTNLSRAQRDKIYERRIRPDLLDAVPAAGTSSPAAMFVAGQPGAGVPLAAAILRCELTKSTGPVVQLSEERLRTYHPAWRAAADKSDRRPLQAAEVQQDVTYWLDRILDDAQRSKLHLMVEDEMRDARSILRSTVDLRKNSYVVQAVFVSTSSDESGLAILAQYDLLRSRGLPPRFVSAQEHASATSNLRIAMGLLEDKRAVDGLRVIDRQAFQFYDNRLIDGKWLRPARAQNFLADAREKEPSPKELVRRAMQWETLTQHLVHDPDVPREVASQALQGRNDAASRCETNAATAQMLQWAREGAAFRRMDRFEFEREFPHHSRAVRSLGAAVLEAEKYQAPESTRFLASARENIAQRIERGDMARIAARERAQEQPSR